MKRALFRLLLLGLLAGMGKHSLAADEDLQRVLQAEGERIAAIEKAIRSSVAIFSPGGKGGGSGVVISPDGFALSNFHVTSPVGDYLQCGMSDGQLYDAVVVGLDPTGDVALIKLFGRDDFPAAEMADSDRVRAGDWCFAVGNPFLLATDFQPTVTYGIVSGVHRYQYPAGSILEYTDCIQTDAAINPGNSGGPLFNAQGQLIGVNGRGSFEKRGRVNVGLGYAISINQIKNFLGHLHSGRIVDHATLGATVDSDSEGRVLVSNILSSSDAYRRGLRYGDEIVSFAGRSIGSVNAFKNALGIFPKGWRVPISYQRDGEVHDVHVRLAGVHSREELLDKVQRHQPPELPEQPDDQPDREQPRKRPNLPSGHPQSQAEVPEEIAAYIKPRRGYANYYFNERNRDRIWDAFVAHGDFRQTAGDWLLRAESSEGRDVEVVLGAEHSSGTFPSGRAAVSADEDLSEQLGPRGSGGLLAALHLWRRLLVEGPQQFGEVYHLGSAPVISQPGLCDVLVATYDVAESRFFFDPDSGQLVALEMFPDSGVDPCEVYFEDYGDVDGRMVPHRLRVRHGDETVLELRLKSVEFSAGAKDKA